MNLAHPPPCSPSQVRTPVACLPPGNHLPHTTIVNLAPVHHLWAVLLVPRCHDLLSHLAVHLPSTSEVLLVTDSCKHY
ncbi:hypothetical protein CHARACLAT_003686 [Characodon lateralis]|uniref:Uncharacterized protein n=1 Tax=Characodon lateralis TaxID=208331 RepID=A0ABU7F0F7_9TELE|nr:hypothetical protein [Characodon lateralis]